MYDGMINNGSEMMIMKEEPAHNFDWREYSLFYGYTFFLIGEKHIFLIRLYLEFGLLRGSVCLVEDDIFIDMFFENIDCMSSSVVFAIC